MVFTTPSVEKEFDGLDYNFTISGAMRLVSTELPDNQ
jgi:hypothetical protein